MTTALWRSSKHNEIAGKKGGKERKRTGNGRIKEGQKAGRKTDIKIARQTYKQPAKETDSQRQTASKPARQTDRQTEAQTITIPTLMNRKEASSR